MIVVLHILCKPQAIIVQGCVCGGGCMQQIFTLKKVIHHSVNLYLS